MLSRRRSNHAWRRARTHVAALAKPARRLTSLALCLVVLSSGCGRSLLARSDASISDLLWLPKQTQLRRSRASTRKAHWRVGQTAIGCHDNLD